MDYSERVRKNLIYLREREGLTYMQLANETSISSASLYNYETKGRFKLQVDRAIILCEFFNVNLEDFLTKDIEVIDQVDSKVNQQLQEENLEALSREELIKMIVQLRKQVEQYNMMNEKVREFLKHR